jgi:flagellar biogenesis protein FliO
MERMFAWSSQEAAQHRKTASSKLAGLLVRIRALAGGHRRKPRLRLCETLSLGEKRFVAVVEYGRHKFLLAGTQQNISLLQRLDESFKNTDQGSRLESNPD